jgi:hypothetical protein
VLNRELLDDALRLKDAGKPRAAMELFESATDGINLELKPALKQNLIDIEAVLVKSPPGPGVLQVSEIMCNKLAPAEAPKRSDPYVKYTLKTGGKEAVTKHLADDLSPVWTDEVLDLDVVDEDTTAWRLLIEVFDHGQDDFLGSLEIDLADEFKGDWQSPAGINIHYYLGDPSKRVVNRVSADYILQETRAKNTYPYGDIKFHLRYVADTYSSHSPAGSRASPGRGSPPAVPSSVRSGGSGRVDFLSRAAAAAEEEEEQEEEGDGVRSAASHVDPGGRQAAERSAMRALRMEREQQQQVVMGGLAARGAGITPGSFENLRNKFFRACADEAAHCGREARRARRSHGIAGVEVGGWLAAMAAAESVSAQAI